MPSRLVVWKPDLQKTKLDQRSAFLPKHGPMATVVPQGSARLAGIQRLPAHRAPFRRRAKKLAPWRDYLSADRSNASRFVFSPSRWACGASLWECLNLRTLSNEEVRWSDA